MLRELLHKLAPSSLADSSFGDLSLGANALAITPVSSGVAALDTALVLGGLPAGRVTEIAGAHSSGKTALGLLLLAEQTSAGKLVAYVDGTGQFYPPAAAAMGIDLARTLLIAPFASKSARRCANIYANNIYANSNSAKSNYAKSNYAKSNYAKSNYAKSNYANSDSANSDSANSNDDDVVLALARAAEIITRSRAFSMVLVDLPRHARLHRTPARRLRVAAQATGSTIIVLSSRSGDVDGAAARIETQGCKRNHTQLRIVKGAHAGAAQGLIEFACKQHRFDNSPPAQVAPVLCRALPGEEAVTGEEEVSGEEEGAGDKMAGEEALSCRGQS